MRNQIVPQEIDSQCRCSPRERDATPAVTVVVYEQFVSKALRIDHETAGPVRPQPDYFTNDSVARNFDGRKVSLRVKGKGTARSQQRRAREHRATQKIPSIN